MAPYRDESERSFVRLLAHNRRCCGYRSRGARVARHRRRRQRYRADAARIALKEAAAIAVDERRAARNARANCANMRQRRRRWQSGALFAALIFLVERSRSRARTLVYLARWRVVAACNQRSRGFALAATLRAFVRLRARRSNSSKRATAFVRHRVRTRARARTKNSGEMRALSHLAR